ncbi:MAG: hypothetical protein AB7R89_32775 [Dehalococcoidia bacterium]
MAINLSPARWAAGLGVAVAVGSAVLVPALAGAQTPPSGSNTTVVTVRCGVDGPRTTARPSDGAVAFGPAVFATTNQDFAAELARALGMSTEQVERAIAASQPDATPMRERDRAFSVTAVSTDADVLDAVAEELGVSVATLTAAVEAAMPDVPECETDSTEAARPAVFIGGDAEMFDAIAEELGNGITGDEVRSAFESAGPPAPRGGVAASPAVKFDVEALAEALGITVEELEEAMETIFDLPRR